MAGKNLTCHSQDLVREGSVWKTLKHPNILEFLGLVFNMSSIPAIVLPYYPSGNVMEYLKAKDTPLADRLPFVCSICLWFEHCRSKLAAQIIGIANGIKYLHEHNPPIIHGDIRGVRPAFSYIDSLIEQHRLGKYSHRQSWMSCDCRLRTHVSHRYKHIHFGENDRSLQMDCT